MKNHLMAFRWWADDDPFIVSGPPVPTLDTHLELSIYKTSKLYPLRQNFRDLRMNSSLILEGLKYVCFII